MTEIAAARAREDYRNYIAAMVENGAANVVAHFGLGLGLVGESTPVLCYTLKGNAAACYVALNANVGAALEAATSLIPLDSAVQSDVVDLYRRCLINIDNGAATSCVSFNFIRTESGALVLEEHGFGAVQEQMTRDPVFLVRVLREIAAQVGLDSAEAIELPASYDLIGSVLKKQP